MAGALPESPAGGDRGEGGLGLQDAESVPDAFVRASGEGDVSVAVQVAPAVGEPAVGVEGVRVGELARVVVGEVRAVEDIGAAADPSVVSRAARRGRSQTGGYIRSASAMTRSRNGRGGRYHIHWRWPLTVTGH